MSQRIRQVTLVAGGLFIGATFVACEQQEEPTTDQVDQPSPMDWQSQNSALLTAPAKAPRTIAAMMFDIGNGPPTASSIMSVIGGTGSSQRHMFQEISYGIQDTNPEYFGPFTLPVHNCLTIACCGPSSDRTGNGATVQMQMDMLGKTFNHYFWVYGGIPSGADCGTWGDEGSPNSIAKYSSYSFHQIVGYAQEIGHNFGMTHEPTMCCGGTVRGNTCTGGTTFADSTTNCQHIEYANSLSFMGNGAHHPSAVHKYHQGWMSGCNLVKAGTSTTLTMVPQELPCDGVQLVQIPAPKTRPGPGIRGDGQGNPPMLTHYYLEMRAPLGFDAGLGPMILVSIGPDLPAANRNAPYVYLLDTNPSTTTLNDSGLKAGGTYMDPGGGLTITVNSIDNASASVTITSSGTGALTCGNSMAFTAPGPGASSCGPLFGGTGTGGTTGAGGRGGTTGTGGTTGAAGRGGTTGTAGTTGAAGRGGTTGTAGATGAAGRGGTTGTAGTTGTGVGTGGSSVSGTGGSSGAGGGVVVSGTGGSNGAAGTGGSSGQGTGGASSTGTGGSTTVSGVAGNGATGTAGTGPGEAAGGCACDTTGGPTTSSALLGLALGMITFARRRPRRAPMG